ncbi:hypothetical protein OSB04_005653 [Centaurea solstitialis]|uniref:Integrase catalytic domain-containing protein n=1 Tax=Centaurea solstitialis TaxID=347529 RepID=A0AA38TP32_9ASTR|nr:hypothetical protein OSB04_005653 [Centaurea solstitialis]
MSAIIFYSPEESLRLIMGKWKLTGQNFPVWKMHLDNVLDAQGKRYVIEKPVSRPGCNAPEKDFAEYFKFMADESDVMSILSFSTSPEFTTDLRVRYCHEVVKNIENQVGFYKKSGKYLIMKEIYSLKLEKGQSVKEHLLEMRKLFKSLSRMGYKVVQEELVHLMWFSLTDEIRNTVSAYIGEPKRDVAKLHEDILASLEPKTSASADLMDTDWIDELGDLSCPECGSKDICAHSMDIDQLDIGLPDAPGIFMIDCLITSYESWVLDTGSGNHICNHLQGFKRREMLGKDRSNLRVGEGQMLVAESIGSYSLSLPSGLVLELENCYYVPKMIKNVISFDLLVDQGFFYKYDYKLISCFKNDIFYFKATPSNGLYVLNLQENREVYHISKRSKNIEDQTYLWHCRLGHINKKRIEKLQKGGLLGSFDFKPFDNCESCLSGKMTKQPFNKDNERANDLLGIIHTDVCGPFSHEARGGYRYFITFTDDFSRYGYVYLMRHKSEAFERFKEFQNEVQNQLDKRIKFLRSDRGGEYLSQEFNNHLIECGIVSQLTPPYTPQMNGVSERRNRTLLDMRPTSEKLKPKSDKCFFVGYPKTTVGYYVYNPTENKVFVARGGDFLEDKFLNTEDTRNDVDLQEVEEDDTSPIVEPVAQQEYVETQPETVEEVQTQDLRRSTRIRQEPDRYLGFLVSQDDGDLNEPTSYGEAVSDSESEQWQEAMKAEIQSMYDNQVWELTDLPQHCRAVGRKWVFKKKTDMDGNVHTFKARLVAKGFTQTHGIDYDETFSPVAMLKSIRILMAISAYFNYEIWQMDVKTAFLNGKLTEDVYMEQPEGFIDPKNPNKVCKLLKSIYGLKQASRSWNLHFDERIKEFGFAKSEFEPCVYTKFSGSIVTFLVLYVDDILLIGNDVPTLQSVNTWLSKCFQMKDLGEAAYILGIKIYRNRSRRLIGLSQSTYIDKILKRFRMDESKKGFIPMQHGIVLSKAQCPVSSEDQDKMKLIPYASAIGSIMYAMLCTRPDVAYSISVTSRYQQNPGEAHWVAVKNILKYMRRTKEMFLVFGGSEDEISVTGYTDASFQTDKDDFRSQSGYVFTLNGGAISWKSSKQDTIADSTTEAEYIAASDAAKEAVWLRSFITDLRVVASISRPIDIYCDNSGAVAQAKEPREHHKSRHVLRKYHLIREIIGRGDVRICKIPTDENVADPLTKPLARAKHEGHTSSIGMQYLDTSNTAEAVVVDADSQDGIYTSHMGEIFLGPLTVKIGRNAWPRSDRITVGYLEDPLLQAIEIRVLRAAKGRSSRREGVLRNAAKLHAAKPGSSRTRRPVCFEFSTFPLGIGWGFRVFDLLRVLILQVCSFRLVISWHVIFTIVPMEVFITPREDGFRGLSLGLCSLSFMLNPLWFMWFSVSMVKLDSGKKTFMAFLSGDLELKKRILLRRAPNNRWLNPINKKFHASNGLPLYDMMYERRCETPICWEEVTYCLQLPSELSQKHIPGNASWLRKYLVEVSFHDLLTTFRLMNDLTIEVLHAAKGRPSRREGVLRNAAKLRAAKPGSSRTRRPVCFEFSTFPLGIGWGFQVFELLRVLILQVCSFRLVISWHVIFTIVPMEVFITPREDGFRGLCQVPLPRIRERRLPDGSDRSSLEVYKGFRK